MASTIAGHMTVASHHRPDEGVTTPHARELEILRQVADDTRRDHRGRAVILHGPRGAGADGLLQAWKRELLRNREHVFETECLPGASVYAPLIEIVTRYVRVVEDLGLMTDELHEVFGKVGSSLGIPRLAGLEPLSERPAEAGSHILFYETLGRLFTDLSHKVQATIILRDLHLADSATRAAVSYLVQNVVTDPVSSFAPDGLQTAAFSGLCAVSLAEESGLRASFGRTLNDRPSVTFLNMRTATEEAVRRFLMQAEVVERFVKSSGGLTDNMSDLIETIPENVEDLFLKRCEQLNDVEAEALGAMAVFAKPIQPDLLLRVIDTTHHKANLSALLERRLLVKRVHRGELLVDLPSEENRKTIYAGLSEEQQKTLHGNIAELLEERSRFGEYADHAELAHHFLRSGMVAKAVEYCLTAAERLHISFAYEQAQELLEGVLPHLEEHETRREVLDRLVDLCACQSEHKRALYYCGLLKKTLDTSARGSLYRRIGEMLLELGGYRKALRVLERARALVAAEPDSQERVDELIRIDAVAAEAFYGRGQYDQVEGLCEASLKKISASPSGAAQRQVFSLTNTLGKVHLFRENYEAASHAFADNLRRSEEHPWPAEATRARFNLGAIALRRCDWESARETFNECLNFGLNAQNPIIKAFCLMNLGVVHHKTHAYEEALDSYLNGLATFKKSGNDLQFAVVALNLGELYLTLGDLKRARALVETSLEVTQNHEIKFFKGTASYVLGGIALEEARFDEAREALSAAAEILGSLGSPMRLRRVNVRQARLALEEGNSELAIELLDTIPLGDEEREAKEIEGKARMLRARVVGQEDPAEAQAQLAAARSLFEEQDSRELIWLADLAMGEQALSEGRRSEAKRLLDRASGLVDELKGHVPEALQQTYLNAPRRQRIGALRKRLDRNDKQLTTELRGVMAPPVQAHYKEWRARYGRIIGENSRLLQVFRMIDRVADSDSTILIQGDSGTGKELIASAIHDNSTRAKGPFVKVNCAAFVETLLLSELFGHEKGAFTGALTRKKGRFELAHGGTIFLDEIGDISPNTQVALLRVLQERQFERVGGGETLEVDARVIVATNRNIEEMVRRNEFRLDLYYRLKGIILELPPLQQRRKDIPRLLHHFIDRHRNGDEAKRFDNSALDYLARYSWPGNIRELENFSRSMILFVDDPVISIEHVLQFQEFFADGAFVDSLPEDFFSELDNPPETDVLDGVPGLETTEPAPAKSTVPTVFEVASDPGDAMVAWAKKEGMGLPDLRKWLEVECIRRALVESEGNITRAAKILDMKRPRLSQIINATSELAELKNELSRQR